MKANTRAFNATTVTELLALSETYSPLEIYSPLLDHKYLLLHLLPSDSDYAGTALAVLAERLRALPCPVIAVGECSASQLLSGLDVIVATEKEVATLIDNITAHPFAAMTLVQLLRHNEHATPAQGLFAESLAYACLQGGVEFAQVLNTLQLPVCDDEESAPVVVNRCADVLHIRLNRPHVRNAYSSAMRDGLYEALQLLAMDGDLSRAVVRGEGSCFCTGGDLAEFGSVADTATAHAIRSTRSVALLLEALRERVEFRVHSACIGAGIELPAFAARVVGDRSTFAQLPEIKLGLLPGAGGTVSITRRIGRHRTAYMGLSARRINAATALQWGLIDAIE